MKIKNIKHKVIKKNVIISGKILEINELGVKVSYGLNKTGFCAINDISDFPILDLDKYFSSFPTYNFKIIKELPDKDDILSYKLAHPMLVKIKKNIIPTAKHFNTLKKTI